MSDSVRIFRLIRDHHRKDGIFGRLFDDRDERIAFTLEHAYASDGVVAWEPKLPPGNYDCVRGMHQLEGMDEPFQTFEITGVPGHSGILFHTGNTNSDSAGCVLLGMGIAAPELDTWIVTASRKTFASFLDRLKGVGTFRLIVL